MFPPGIMTNWSIWSLSILECQICFLSLYIRRDGQLFVKSKNRWILLPCLFCCHNTKNVWFVFTVIKIARFHDNTCLATVRLVKTLWILMFLLFFRYEAANCCTTLTNLIYIIPFKDYEFSFTMVQTVCILINSVKQR